MSFHLYQSKMRLYNYNRGWSLWPHKDVNVQYVVAQVRNIML